MVHALAKTGDGFLRRKTTGGLLLALLVDWTSSASTPSSSLSPLLARSLVFLVPYERASSCTACTAVGDGCVGKVRANVWHHSLTQLHQAGRKKNGKIMWRYLLVHCITIEMPVMAVVSNRLEPANPALTPPFL